MVFKSLINKFKELRKNEGFNKYLKNTFWLFLEKFLKFFSTIIIGGFVARYLGPADFGALNYCISFVLIFAPFSVLGLDGIIVKALVDDRYESKIILGTAFRLKLAGALILISIILLISLCFFDNDALGLYIIIISLTSIFQSFNVIDFFFQSKVKSKYVVYSNIIMLIISTIIKLYLIYSKGSLLSFVLLILFDSFLLASSLLYFYYNEGKTLSNWRFDFKIAKRLLSSSWPLMFSGIFIMLYMRIDQIMIQYLIGNQAVGKYAAAVRLGEASYFIPMVLSSSLFPAIINSRKKDINLYYDRIQKFFNLVSKISIISAVCITILADWLIEILYGIEYTESSQVLKIHIWASVFVFLGVASSKWFITEGLQRISFWRTLAGLVINIVGNLLFIERYGIIGAAVSTLLSQIMATFLFDFFHPKTKRIFFMKLKSLLIYKL
ncbi:flippase [Gelatiniphilus marinus]|uniref:Flippase n=1 Tax=Gelatiniphilus marinus TaxID=1759464 RepID=A0ABW5JWT7_9FLAO